MLNEVEAAARFFVLCRQSLAGRMDSFAPLSRTRTRRQMNEQVSAWLGAIEGLSDVHNRLKRVAILCRPALKVIQEQDGEQTLYYLDPPYLPTTRAATAVYQHEMPQKDHADLLGLIQQVKAKVILSGYANPLYGAALKDWNVKEFDLPNNAASGEKKRRMSEVVWTNY